MPIREGYMLCDSVWVTFIVKKEPLGEPMRQCCSNTWVVSFWWHDYLKQWTTLDKAVNKTQLSLSSVYKIVAFLEYSAHTFSCVKPIQKYVYLHVKLVKDIYLCECTDLRVVWDVGQFFMCMLPHTLQGVQHVWPSSLIVTAVVPGTVKAADAPVLVHLQLL